MNATSIRELRRRLRETQAEFGRRFNVSQITVGYWESGRSQPVRQRLNQLAALASASDAVTTAMPPFRTIQYLGSKLRLADNISRVIDQVARPGDRVGDLFAGTGVISYANGARRPVTAVDVQAYSERLTRALLTGQPENLALAVDPAFWNQVADVSLQIRRLLGPLIELERDALRLANEGNPGTLIELMEFGSLAVHCQRPLKQCPIRLARSLEAVACAVRSSKFSTANLTATHYFGGPYFAYEQSIELDAISMVAQSARPATTRCLEAVLLSAASEIVNTVGKQFAQPMKLAKADGHVPRLLLQRALRDRSLSVKKTFEEWAARWQERLPCGTADHRVICGDVLDFVIKDRSCGAFYADPPYTIDHYSRFYHVLETLVRRDSPRLDEMKKNGEVTVMRGVYRNGRYQSAFCIPSEAPGAFDRLFKGAAKRGAPLVLSYSPFDELEGHRPRLLTLTDLSTLAKRHYRKITVTEVSEHSHRKLNTKIMNSSVRSDAERLVICEA